MCVVLWVSAGVKEGSEGGGGVDIVVVEGKLKVAVDTRD